MVKCTHHTGRPSVFSLFGKNYCAECKEEIKAAQTSVPRHVDPKPCFIEYDSRHWVKLEGTGCAHWIAHQKGITRGAKCLEGCTYRVPDLISSLREVEVEDVQPGDIWAGPGRTEHQHAGIVERVTPGRNEGDPPVILIENDSSGQGGVRSNDWASYLRSKGKFYRP
jgi:hypothetical protein